MNEETCIIGRETQIGREGEHNARTLLFSVAALLEKWPGTVPRMLVRRPGDAQPYMTDAQLREDGVMAWTVTRYDTQRRGRGVMWVAFIAAGEDGAEETVGLSDPTPLFVRPGPRLLAPDMPLQAQPSWLQQAIAMLDAMPQQIGEAVRAALEEAKASGDFRGEQGPVGLMGRQGPAGPAGRPGKDGETPHILLTRNEDGLHIGVLTGDVGESQIIYDGVSPTVNLTRDADGVTIRVTDAEGTKKAKVYDGKSVVFDGEGSGGAAVSGGLIWALPGDTSSDPVLAGAYQDQAMETLMTYEEGRALLMAGARVVLYSPEDEMCIYTTPSMFQLMDDAKAAVCLIFAGEVVQILLSFSDTVME